jgi:hypothetical protein
MATCASSGRWGRRLLARLAAATPLLPAKVASKSLLVRGLNALVATVSTPLAAPVVASARMRGGNAASDRGAASLVVEAIATARQAGCTGVVVVRADSACTPRTRLHEPGVVLEGRLLEPGAASKGRSAEPGVALEEGLAEPGAGLLH